MTRVANHPEVFTVFKASPEYFHGAYYTFATLADALTFIDLHGGILVDNR